MANRQAVRGTDLEHVLRHVKEHRRAGRTIVLTNGCFDILHPGHVRYLEQAKALGGILVVAVNSDDSVRRLKGDGRPINPAADRTELLLALSAVDYAVEFDELTPVRVIDTVRPDVYVKGGDYTAEDLVGLLDAGHCRARLALLDYHPGHSTSRIVERIRSNTAGNP